MAATGRTSRGDFDVLEEFIRGLIFAHSGGKFLLPRKAYFVHGPADLSVAADRERFLREAFLRGERNGVVEAPGKDQCGGEGETTLHAQETGG